MGESECKRVERYTENRFQCTGAQTEKGDDATKAFRDNGIIHRVSE